MPDEPVYNFYTDDGEASLTYPEYLSEKLLRGRINNRKAFARFIMGREIFCFAKSEIRDNKSIRDTFMGAQVEFKKCPIRWFDPSGPGARGFLNDTTSEIKALIGANQTGKTATGVIDDILDIVPCDPKWEIFTQYGVSWRPWRGDDRPIILATLNYTWKHVNSINWPRLKQWIPVEFLPEKMAEKHSINWERQLSAPLTCGSEVFFGAYGQDAEMYEGFVWTTVHCDEQGVEAHFDGADQRVSTQGCTPEHKFTLTPHVVEGRPDTGAGSWLYEMFEEGQNKGKTINKYKLSLNDVPDWIMPETKKEEKKQSWIIQPRKQGNWKRYREGCSRVYGEWHVSGGLVYDEWVREVHCIDPFKIPNEWTLYRGIDFGTRHPFVCIWIAVSPDQDIYLFDELYSVEKTMEENALLVIEKSGNSRRKVESDQDANGRQFDCFEEIQNNMRFERTVMDPKSFATPDRLFARKTIGDMMKMFGLPVRAAPTHTAAQRIPLIKPYLEIDYSLKHPFTGKMGKPRVFVFNTLKHFVREIERRKWDQPRFSRTSEKLKDTPEKKNDDTQNAWEYAMLIPPRYLPPTERFVEEEQEAKRGARNARTGY